MKKMLVCDAEVFLFISLLIVDYKVVKKYLVEFIEIFFQANSDLLLSWLLIIIQTKFSRMLWFNDGPELFKSKAAKRRISISFLCLQFFLLQTFVNAVCYLHVLLYPTIYSLCRNVLWLNTHLKILGLYLIIFKLMLLVIISRVLSL